MNYNKNIRFTSRDVALYGLFTALVFLATNLKIPGESLGGLFHLGNIMAFTIAIVFGKRAGAISAALGMSLFDLSSGAWAIYAPFTFVIRFAMGYILGYMAFIHEEDNKKSVIFTILGIIIATVIMLVGYCITEYILVGNILKALDTIRANFMQCVVGTVLGLPLAASLRAGFKMRNIKTQL
jgi:uncharacterized membrane protein